MGLIERFTRDTASKYVWAFMALVAAVGLAFAFTSGGAALDDERANSQERAVSYVQDELDPRLQGSDLNAPITGQAASSLEDVVERTILADDRLTRVRIWSTDGRLLFSTDQGDTPGSDAGLNDELLAATAADGVLTRSNISDTGGQDDPERSLLRTYVPLRASAIAEIDQSDEGTLAAVRTEWMYYEILAGAMLLVFLVLTGLSLRDPIEPINVGVPFAASSVPAGFSLIDDDRLNAVQEVYRLASERVARLKGKLEESETARRRLEGDIQRALSKAAGVARPTVPTVMGPPAPVVKTEPPVVQVPESEVVKAPLGETWTAAPAGPLARASRDQKPLPPAVRRAKQAVEKPKRTVKRPKPERERQQEREREWEQKRAQKLEEKREREQERQQKRRAGAPAASGRAGAQQKRSASRSGSLSPHSPPPRNRRSEFRKRHRSRSVAWPPWPRRHRRRPDGPAPGPRPPTPRPMRPPSRPSSGSRKATASRTERIQWIREPFGPPWRGPPPARSRVGSGCSLPRARPRSRPAAPRARSRTSLQVVPAREEDADPSDDRDDGPDVARRVVEREPRDGRSTDGDDQHDPAHPCAETELLPQHGVTSTEPLDRRRCRIGDPLGLPGAPEHDHRRQHPTHQRPKEQRVEPAESPPGEERCQREGADDPAERAE